MDSQSIVYNNKYVRLRKIERNIILVKDINIGKKYIIKRHYDDIDGKNELGALTLLKGCPNIVQLIDSFVEDDKLYIVLERLHLTLHDFDKMKIDIRKVIYQVMLAIKQCHDKNIVHGDIKPKNIMFTKKGDVKLIDFNLCCIADNKTDVEYFKFNNIIQSSSYRSPEICEGINYVYLSADIWSMGMLIYFLIGDKYNILINRDLSYLYASSYSYNSANYDKYKQIFVAESDEQHDAIKLYFGQGDVDYEEIYDKYVNSIYLLEKEIKNGCDFNKLKENKNDIMRYKYIMSLININDFVPLIVYDHVVLNMDEDIYNLFINCTRYNFEKRYKIDDCLKVISFPL